MPEEGHRASSIGGASAIESAEVTESRQFLRPNRLGGPYRRLWTARTVSQWGDTVNVVALALLVFHLTGSGIGVSGVVAAEIAPVLLLAPVAGVVIDRLPRVRVMVAADLVRFGLALLLVAVQGHLFFVYGVAFAMSAATVFFNPAASSMLPSIVGEDDLVAANSGIWTAAVLSQIVVAPVAGLLVAAFGFGVAFAVNAASFAVSALVLRGLPPIAGGGQRTTWFAAVREGARQLLAHRVLRALAAAQLLAALSAGATSALLVVLAKEHLRATTGQYGLLLAAIGVGAAIGPFALRRFVAHPKRPAVVFGAFALRGVVDLALAATPAGWLAAALAILVVYGVGTSTGMVTFNSLLQSVVPEDLRGRVFATFDVLWQLGRLVSLGVGGFLADALGVRAVYLVGGLLLLAAALTGTGPGAESS